MLAGKVGAVSNFERARRNAAAKAAHVVDELVDQLVEFEFDPLGFVEWAFPWGQEGTALEKRDGPEQWQRELLRDIGIDLRMGGDAGCVIRDAIAAGHGVGKSAFVSWLALWAISTKANTRGVVTANTDTQLRTKTWAELSKWHGLFIARELFRFTATSIFSADASTQKQWRIDAIPWSATNPEAFAGLHNQGNRLLIIFDEASAIDDIIHEVIEGALTDADTQILCLNFGNPTRTTGKFYQRIAGQAYGWRVRKVDSRTVRFSNKALIDAWITEYGEDSDFVRVRVKGEPPRAGLTTFISAEVVFHARHRRVPLGETLMHPKIIGVDQAGFGDDKSVITVRQGDKVLLQMKYSGMDDVDLSNRVIDVWRKFDTRGHQDPGVSMVVCEVVGLAGSGVWSILKRVPNMPLQVYSPAAMMNDDSPFFNLRAEMWGRMKRWLERAEIPDDDELGEQLTSIEYGQSLQRQKIQLESKKAIKAAGRTSPDCADSLAMTFMDQVMQQRNHPVSVQGRPVMRVKRVWTRN